MDENIEKQFYRISLQPLPLPDNISYSAKSLLSMLLRKDPEERATFDDIIHHPWLKEMEDVDLYESVIF
jgi:serine/threonine protein kinase